MYPALANYSNTQAFDHWLEHGIPEGRSPNPYYHAYEYYQSDVGAFQPIVDLENERVTNTNLWNHWRVNGIYEGRQGSPLFHSKYYLESNPDVSAVWGATNYNGALAHYISHGASENRRPAAADVDWSTAAMSRVYAVAESFAHKFDQFSQESQMAICSRVGFPEPSAKKIDPKKLLEGVEKLIAISHKIVEIIDTVIDLVDKLKPDQSDEHFDKGEIDKHNQGEQVNHWVVKSNTKEWYLVPDPDYPGKRR
jgi:hypothetical protein